MQLLGGFNGLGLQGNGSAPVTFEAFNVANDDLLKAHSQGLDCMLQVALPWFSVGTAAMAHGLCLAVVDATASRLRSNSN